MNIFYKIIPALLVAMFCITTFSEAAEETNNALSPRQKGMIPIAAFTAIGNISKLETALSEGMDAGLTINEIKEILIQTYAYAGFPRALNGIDTYMSVMDKRKERGINDKTGKEATPVPADFNKNTYGHKVRNMLVGMDVSKRTSGYPIFTPVIDQFLVEHLFADIFYRDILTYQERELVTISILAAMTGTETQLKAHLKISMNMGFSKAQLEGFVSVLRRKVSVESAERVIEILNNLLGITSHATRINSLKVIKNGQPTKGSADYFTGRVTIESMFASEISGYSGGIVNFEAGARTAWHSHPLGQTLIVISGNGLVQAEGEAVQKIKPGDVVWIPKNMRHWHGAAPNNSMSHVAISTPLNESAVQWMEHVDDKQYGN